MIVVIILMGVSGCGKTTVGKLLAEKLGWPFIEGDDYHSLANKSKMASGQALTDSDRKDWLNTLSNIIRQRLTENKPSVLACSALRQSYRDLLSNGSSQVIFVYLKGSYSLIFQRLSDRSSHFMKTNLLQSQFETLEEPQNALTVDITLEPQALVAEILTGLGLITIND